MTSEEEKNLLLGALKTLIKHLEIMYQISTFLYNANAKLIYYKKAETNSLYPSDKDSHQEKLPYKKIAQQLTNQCIVENKILCDHSSGATPFYAIPLPLGKKIMGCLVIFSLDLNRHTPEISERDKEDFLLQIQNLMTDSLKSFHRNDHKIKQLEQKAAELEFIMNQREIKSLESQLKPHFIFNTLNLVGQLIYLGKNDDSREVIYALSKLLRFALEKKELVRLIDEIDYVKNYLFIQRNRYGEKLKYRFDISESILSCLIPAFTLQPLVENAIKYGIEPKGMGMINIYGRLIENRVLLKVTDNGNGFVNDVKDPASLGTGIYNLKRRLWFYFQDQYQFSIHSEKESGIEVVIDIPFKTDKDDMYIPVFWFNK